MGTVRLGGGVESRACLSHYCDGRETQQLAVWGLTSDALRLQD